MTRVTCYEDSTFLFDNDETIFILKLGLSFLWVFSRKKAQNLRTGDYFYMPDEYVGEVPRIRRVKRVYTREAT